MSDEKKSRKAMYKQLAVSTLKSVGLAASVLAVLLATFHNELTISTPSLVTGLIGTVLIFIGGSLMSDALGRWGSLGLPHYKYGSLLQTIGLGFTVFALIVK